MGIPLFKMGLTDQFHKYLYGNMFNVYTDNNPLMYMLTTAKLDAMGHRWIASLANLPFISITNPEKVM